MSFRVLEIWDVIQIQLTPFRTQYGSSDMRTISVTKTWAADIGAPVRP